MKKRRVQLALIAFSCALVAYIAITNGEAGVAIVTAAFALIGSILADFASIGAAP